MTQHFEHINDPEARSFIVDRLVDIVRQGDGGRAGCSRLYLLPYSPAQQEAARELVDALVSVDLPNRGIRAIDVNLYDIVLAELDRQDIWQPLCEEERNMDRNELIMMLQDTVDVHDVLAPAVMESIARQPCDLVFVTGVGETFPYVRTHTLLESLDAEEPVVLMFPGQYRRNADGRNTLDILDIPSAGNGGHYRATNVFDL